MSPLIRFLFISKRYLIVLISIICLIAYLFVYFVPQSNNDFDKFYKVDDEFDVLFERTLINRNLRLIEANISRKYIECDIFADLKLYPSIYGYKSCQIYRVEDKRYYKYAIICESDGNIKKSAFLKINQFGILECVVDNLTINCIRQLQTNLVCDCNGVCNNDSVFKNLPVSSPVKSRKVFSFSIFGNITSYNCGAVRQVRLAKLFFPDWSCRIYIDTNVPHYITEMLEKEAEVIRIDQNNEFSRKEMFLRFLIADDNDVDIYCIRDSDALFSYRESLAIQEWLESGKGFHSIYDHFNHGMEILGGGWCGRKRIANMRSLIISHSRWNTYGDDQHFLATVIWPLIKNDTFVHHSFQGVQCDDVICHPYPVERIACEFFGVAVRDEYDITQSNAWIRQSYLYPRNSFRFAAQAMKTIGLLFNFN